jgi:hypothetical protein
MDGLAGGQADSAIAGLGKTKLIDLEAEAFIKELYEDGAK